MRILGPELSRPQDCETVLRSLPMWFGIEHALRMYVDDTARLPTFAVEEGTRIAGFLTLREHFPAAWEVHCMAVAADRRRAGLGSALLAHAQAWLREKRVDILQVKTVAATSPSPEYAQTRKFYEAQGFHALEVFPELWDPWNPALQCVKWLGREP